MEQLVSIFPLSWIFFKFQTHRNYGSRWIWTMRNLESQRQRPQWRSRRKDEKSWGYFFKSAIKCLFVCQHTRLVNKQTNRTAKNISNLLKMWCFWRDLEHWSTHIYDAQRAFHISLCWAVNQNPQYLMLSQAMWPGMFWLATASKLFFPSNGLWLTLILHFETKILSVSPKVSFLAILCHFLAFGSYPSPLKLCQPGEFCYGHLRIYRSCQRYFFSLADNVTLPGFWIICLSFSPLDYWPRPAPLIWSNTISWKRMIFWAYV